MRTLALSLTVCAALILPSLGCGGPQKPDPEPTGATPDKPKTSFDKGVEAIEGEAWQEALEHFEAVLASEAENAQAVYYRAVALERLGKLDEAVAGYEQAVKLDGKLVAARVNLAAIYLEAKPPKTKEAITMLEPAAAMDPEAYDVRENLGYAHRVEGNLEKAEAFYREALAIADHPRIHFSLADVLFEAGKADEAGAHYEKALDGFVEELDTLVVIAHRLGKTKRYEACVKAFSVAIELDKDEPGFLLHRGLCRHGLGKLDKERADYQAAIALDEKFAPAWYYLGMSYVETEPKKAKDALNKAVEHGGTTDVGKRAKAQLAKLK